MTMMTLKAYNLPDILQAIVVKMKRSHKKPIAILTDTGFSVMPFFRFQLLLPGKTSLKILAIMP